MTTNKWIERNKPGVLSDEEKDFIRRRCQYASVEEIAAALHRRKTPISKFIKENHLLSFEMSTDEQESTLILEQLHNKPLWAECQKQFADEELEYFEKVWIDMMKQLSGDVLSSEELQLKKFITYEILRDRCMIKQSKSTKDLDAAERDLEQEMGRSREKRNMALIGTLRETINSIRASQSVYVKEFVELSDKQEKIANALRTSRDNRVKRVDDAKTSFTGLLKLLDDEREREKLGHEAYLFDKAREQKTKEMMELFEFVDGEVNPLLMTAETVRRDNNEQ